VKNRYSWKVIFLLVAFAFSFGFLVAQERVDANDHFMEKLGIIQFDEGVEAPDFTLNNLAGKEVGLKDYRGKIVFLNFWATWCGPCREEMPSMEKLHNNFSDKDIVILAVDMQESAKKVIAFKEELKLSFPILLDSSGSVSRSYAVRAIPTTYFVDREGYILGAALGARDWSSKTAFAFFENLLNGSPASPDEEGQATEKSTRSTKERDNTR
jgi:peroxiredoxin